MFLKKYANEYLKWIEQGKAKENSIVNELFEGDLFSTITCHACKHKSIFFEKFGELSLDLVKFAKNSDAYKKSR